MILIDKIKLETFGNRRLRYYSDLKYDISGEYFEIRIEDLNIGSRKIVPVKCDYCNKDVNITYREYKRNILLGNKYACCKFCGSKKAKETNIKNIGVENHMMLDEIQEKTKKTNLERYGVEFLQQSDEIKQRSKRTLLKLFNESTFNNGLQEICDNNLYFLKDRTFVEKILTAQK